MNEIYSYDVDSLSELLGTIIQRNISPDQWSWINEKQATDSGSAAFHTAFAALPRKIGKALIPPDDEEQISIQKLRPGFSIKNWSVDRLCRVWLLMHVPASEKNVYVAAIDRLFLSAEMSELVALYSSLPLLAYPETWRKRCAEGIRSNIGDVLLAIICNNPYPSEQLDEKAWNQMILKGFFTEKPIDQVVHLDSRANEELAFTLSDYAHERWAAGRSVNPLLWRCVGKFIDARIFPDIQKIARADTIIEREAAALACWDSHFEPAKKLLEAAPRLKTAIEKGDLNWDSIAQKISHQS